MRMYINRGNHEAKEMNRTYGFEGEAKHKHGEQTYKVGIQPLVPYIVLIVFYIQLFAHVFTTRERPSILHIQTPTNPRHC